MNEKGINKFPSPVISTDLKKLTPSNTVRFSVKTDFLIKVKKNSGQQVQE